MTTDFSRQALAGLRLLLVLTLLLGVGYPAAVGLAARAFADRADGQPVSTQGRAVGSALLGQQFEGGTWFHSRPSASDYDSLASGPSNLGPSNPELIAAIERRRSDVARRESVRPDQVPADAVTASGSGLDPHISPAYARLQVPRVARERDLDEAAVQRLVDDHTSGRFLGVHGEPAVNVLELNLAVRAATERAD